MQEWDIICNKCGAFLFTEKKDEFGNIHCVSGSYKLGRYNVREDAFYCSKCYKEITTSS